MATIRINCTAEGLDHNWIEYSSSWTRGETRRLESAEDEDVILAIISGKVVRCHIECADGTVLETGESITMEAVGDMDETLAAWLVQSLYTMIARKRVLGNVSASALLATNGKATMPTPTKTSEK